MKHPQRLYSRILTIIRYQLLSLSLPLSSPFHPLNSPSSFSHDTPRTELPASARFDLKERGEQVEETEKRMEKGWKGWRRKTDGQRRRFHEDQWDPEPDSKLEKICSEFLDWDPPEIALSLDPSTHTPSLSLSLSLSAYFSLCFELIWSLSRGLHGTPTRDTSTLWPHRGSSIFHLDLILVFHQRSIFGFRGNFRDPTRQRRNNFHLLIYIIFSKKMYMFFLF